MDMLKTLQDLMLTEAVSGYEHRMAAKMKAHFAPLADEVVVDKAGNVSATLRGTDPSVPSLMVFAHMDQLGFIVRKIEENGLIQVDRLGGIPEKVLPALDVSVRTLDGNYLPGVIGVKSHHAASADEKYKVDLVTSLYFDLGAHTRQEVEAAGVHIGCPVCYRPSFTSLMGGLVAGTSVDNRGNCAALIGIAEALAQSRPRATVHLVGTVWEEFSLRGAVFAARRLKPALAICLDVALSGDTPDLSSRYAPRLSNGPTVTLYHFHGRGTLNGTIAHEGLYRHALACAKETKINLQEAASLGIWTDLAYVQMEGDYVAGLDMGFPVRYTHTPVETCDPSDIVQLEKLVTHMIGRIGKDFPIHRLGEV
jgi:putative aminopeptidase FrvX